LHGRIFFCVLVDCGLIFWIVGGGEWDLLGLRNVGVVERYSRMGIAVERYSRMGIAVERYSRMGIAVERYSRMGIAVESA
jgi:hypothetical protein